MINILRKDLYIQKKILMYGFLYVLMMMLLFDQEQGAMLQAAVVAITYLMMHNSNAYDEKNNSDLLLNCLPISRAEIVLSKYLSVFMYFVIALVYYFIVSTVVSLIPIHYTVSMLSAPSIISSLFTVLLINSIYLPIYFKMGYTKSRIVNILIFVGFFIIFTSLVNTRNFISGKNPQTIGVGESILMNLSETTTLVMIAVVGIVIFSISYVIANNFYKRKDF